MITKNEPSAEELERNKKEMEASMLAALAAAKKKNTKTCAIL